MVTAAQAYWLNRKRRRARNAGVGVPAWVLSGAALDLDFANTRGFNSIDRSKSTPDAILTYTAPSPKWVHNAAGLLVQSSGQLPYDYDPVTHEALGVLIEEQRTNLFTYSEQFDNAAWGKGNVTVTANQAVAPDGTTTADALVPTATGGVAHAVSFGGAFGAGTFSFSLYAKANGYPRLGIRVYDGSAYRIKGTFDLSNGTVVNTNAGTMSITSVGNGWYRIAGIGTSPAGNMGVISGWAIESLPSGALCQDVFAGDGVSGALIWGAQVEAGAFPTSYIPTVASQVTRAADQVSIPTSAFAYNGATSTVVLDVRDLTTVSSSMGFLALTATSSIGYRNGNADLHAYDGVSPHTLANVTGLISSPFKYSFAWDAAATASYCSILGLSVSSGTAYRWTSATGFYLGRRFGAVTGRCHIKRLTYFPTRKANSELQALAA